MPPRVSGSTVTPSTAAALSRVSTGAPARRTRVCTAVRRDSGTPSSPLFSARSTSTTNRVCPRVRSRMRSASSSCPAARASWSTASGLSGPTSTRRATGASAVPTCASFSARTVVITSSLAPGGSRPRKCMSSIVDCPAYCRSSTMTRTGLRLARPRRKARTASNARRRSISMLPRPGGGGPRIAATSGSSPAAAAACSPSSRCSVSAEALATTGAIASTIGWRNNDRSVS